MSIKFSIIIVNFNTMDITISCLDSIYKHTPKSIDFEIILVDNASSDGSVNAIKKKFGNKVKIISNNQNYGFGKANNQAAKIAQGQYLIFLNSDTLFTQNSLGKLALWVSNHSDADILGIKLTNPDNSLQYSYGYFPSLLKIFFWSFFLDDLSIIKKYFPALHIEHPDRYLIDQKIDWVTGAFILVKKDVFNKTLGFDEKMFMYAEEMEWQIRANKLGFKIFFTPITSIIHIGRSSSKNSNSTLATVSEYKGILYIYKKHHQLWQYPIAKFFIKSGIYLRALLFAHKRTSYVQAIREI